MCGEALSPRGHMHSNTSWSQPWRYTDNMVTIYTGIIGDYRNAMVTLSLAVNDNSSTVIYILKFVFWLRDTT
jgi:hypothetical protein